MIALGDIVDGMKLKMELKFDYHVSTTEEFTEYIKKLNDPFSKSFTVWKLNVLYEYLNHLVINSEKSKRPSDRKLHPLVFSYGQPDPPSDWIKRHVHAVPAKVKQQIEADAVLAQLKKAQLENLSTVKGG